MSVFDRFEVLSFDVYGTLIDFEGGILEAMMDRMLSGEIDKETFKTGIDILMPRRTQSDDIAYS